MSTDSAAVSARERYMRRVMIPLGLYAAGVLIGGYLINRVGVSQPVALVLAVWPGLAVAFLFYAIGMRIVEEKDEFIRMLIVRQHLIAMGFVLSAISVWIFLEMYGLAPGARGLWVLMLWVGGLLLGGISNRITHGVWVNWP